MTFSYRARRPSGEAVSGTMRALDRDAAIAVLRERMLVPSAIRSTSPWTFARFFARPKPRERLAFFRAYATLERAGIDFATSFALLASQTSSARMRDALDNVRHDVERGGERLWSAMSNRPNEFSDLEIAMVAAGEEAGNREEIFERLATFLERDERLRKRLSSALLYPALVLAAAAGVSVYLVAFVVPQFAKLFASFGIPPSTPLVLLSRATSFASDPMAAGAFAAVAVAGAWLAARALRTPEGAVAFDRVRMRVPLFGEAIRKTTLARTARVVATLLQSGVNQIRALEVAVPVAESPVYGGALALARDRIADGRAATLEEALHESGVFPALLLGFVRVGTSAGNVPAMLAKIADYYEDDVEALVATIPTVVQTAVTIALGVIVGAIVYVVYVPLSTLGSSIH